MKKSNYFVVSLFGFNALLWTIRAIDDVVYPPRNNSVWRIGLSILNAVLWNISFVLNLKRHRFGQDEQ